ncbi:MAG: hypothetical protein COB17_10900 [Sulfurimonas sp.]|nr:MAG: hypothetical protein COB17_10900 [Sulfurimonas sp.]
MIDMYGSGNRTARDILDDGEITIVFNAFDGSPKILRLFCKSVPVMEYKEQRPELRNAIIKL